MQKLKLVILFVIGLMLLPTMSYAVTSTATTHLQARVKLFTGFYAKFTQQVLSEKGEVLQQSSGEVWAAPPNLFDWKIEQPQQSQLISNGKTIWMYEPNLQQVTCLSMSHVTQNALFLLILDNNPNVWAQFNITQQGNLFTLTPITQQAIQSYQINISAKGVIHSFRVIEQDGQTTNYDFTAQRNMKLDASSFNFKIPAGVTVDDQRE